MGKRRATYEGKEIAALVVGTAVHVVSQLHAVLGNVGGRVADGHLAVAALGNVLAHIASDCLDERRRESGRSGGVNNLVAGKEGQCVGVVDERINGGKDTLQVLGVVGRCRVGTVDGVQRVVDIEDGVDTSRRQGVHAGVVALGVVGDVHADSVDAQLFKFSNVAVADVCIGQGIGRCGGTARLVVDAADIEACLASPERWKEVS